MIVLVPASSASATRHALARARQVRLVLALGVLALGAVACGSSPSPQPVEPPGASELANTPAPEERETSVDEPGAPLEIEAVTQIPACDEYLSLYRACEPKLESAIMAGDRRTYRAERGGLEYLLTTEERNGLPDACAEMLDALRADCAVP